MAKKPTYKVDGAVERFDERDTVFSREILLALVTFLAYRQAGSQFHRF